MCPVHPVAYWINKSWNFLYTTYRVSHWRLTCCCNCCCWLSMSFALSVWVNRITYWSQSVASLPHKCQPPLLSARQHPIMVIVWRLRGNIIRTAPCWVVWHNVHSQQHTQVSSSYRSGRLGLSHWDPYVMHRGGCLELYYCNMVEWSWWDSQASSARPTGFLQCFDTDGLVVIWPVKIVPDMTYNVFGGTLNVAQLNMALSWNCIHWLP